MMACETLCTSDTLQCIGTGAGEEWLGAATCVVTARVAQCDNGLNFMAKNHKGHWRSRYRPGCIKVEIFCSKVLRNYVR